MVRPKHSFSEEEHLLIEALSNANATNAEIAGVVNLRRRVHELPAKQARVLRVSWKTVSRHRDKTGLRQNPSGARPYALRPNLDKTVAEFDKGLSERQTASMGDAAQARSVAVSARSGTRKASEGANDD